MSTDTAALLALASRVEAGERTFAIECEIAKELGDGRMPPPNVTVSVDAIEALRQRVLPGWRIYMISDERPVHQMVDGQLFYCGMDRHPALPASKGFPYAQVLAKAPTEPAARLAALLRALAMEAGRG